MTEIIVCEQIVRSSVCLMGKRTSAYRLPEREEDHKLDHSDFEKRSMVGDVLLDLHIELDDAVHGYGDTNTLKTGDLSAC